MAKVKTSKAQRTLVTFLLDRSASMSSIKPQTISAFNEYLKGLQDTPVKSALIDFTFLQFDTQSLDKICVAVPVKDVKPLSGESFVPRASTPLIDSAYDTIKAVEGQEKAKGAKIVICFQTDGEENSSRNHTWEDLKALIAEKTKLGWQFNFMGAGIDVYQQSRLMGLSVNQTMSYDNDPAMTAAAFRASASNTRSFAMGMSSNTNYSSLQKSASGDKFFKQPPSIPQPVPQPKPNKPLDLNSSDAKKVPANLTSFTL